MKLSVGQQLWHLEPYPKECWVVSADERTACVLTLDRSWDDDDVAQDAQRFTFVPVAELYETREQASAAEGAAIAKRKRAAGVN